MTQYHTCDGMTGAWTDRYATIDSTAMAKIQKVQTIVNINILICRIEDASDEKSMSIVQTFTMSVKNEECCLYILWGDTRDL